MVTLAAKTPNGGQQTTIHQETRHLKHRTHPKNLLSHAQADVFALRNTMTIFTTHKRGNNKITHLPTLVITISRNLNTLHELPTHSKEILAIAPLFRVAMYCGDLGINSKTPNRILTRRLPDTKCINASPRIRLHASIRLKIRKKKNNKK